MGQFTVYYKDVPVVIDAGTMRYSIKNFSPQRYDLWYTGAQGHNAPVVNGIMQQQGRDFVADIRLAEPVDSAVRLSADLSRAYPVAAEIRSLNREMTVWPQSVEVTDRIEVPALKTATLRLYSMLPVSVRKGKVLFGDLVELSLDGLTPGETGIEIADRQMAANYADKIYWIELRGGQGSYSLRFAPILREK
ncbi:hypothetical protein SDC9_181178 [bioreactor metagenome]|uniref:Uncharacterized protein n=1 Tax=bioreactor metagenome TaxID=1076179 RepID=A0A645H3W1_9ZZZZ